MTQIQKLFTIVLVLLVIVLGALTIFQQKKLAGLQKDPQKAAQEEVAALVAEVGKIFELPTDEQPTIATVSDPEALKDQPFFAKAKQGDKVLIYTNAKKAILYDPVNKKIIEVAPISIGNSEATTPAKTTTSSEE